MFIFRGLTFRQIKRLQKGSPPLCMYWERKMSERQERRGLERMLPDSSMTAPCLKGNTQEGGKAIRVIQGLLGR